MKKIKTIVCIFALVLAILLPIITPIATAMIIPSQYSKTFVGELDDKVARLDAIKEEKCIVIGGSSVAFGLDSALMEEYIGMPVVNFGLYAAIGTRAMMELSRASVGEGDIIILAPETDPETFSMYFSSDTTLKAIDSNYSLITRFSADSILSMLGGIFKHSVEKIAASTKPLSDPEGIYNSASFDAYGDIRKGLRDENVMPLFCDPNKKIDLSPEILDPEFISYINDYVAFCNRRGAEVYFSFAPMNSMAIAEGTTDQSIAEFEEYLADQLDCEIISFASTYIMDPGYFYDTNYHLNDTGVVYRTRRLAEDLMLVKLEDGPEPPALRNFDNVYIGDPDENARFFLYEEMENGGLCIVGLTDEGKSQISLTVPLGYDGKKVIAIGADAFSNGACTSVEISENSNLRYLLENCFHNSSVTDLWIYYTFSDEDSKLNPPPGFEGMTVHIPPGSIYRNHYDWNETSSGFEFVEDAVR